MALRSHASSTIPRTGWLSTATHASLPAGAQEIVIGVLMILILILKPRGLVGAREWQWGGWTWPRRLRSGEVSPA